MNKLNAQATDADDIVVPADLADDRAEAIRRKEGSEIARVVVDRQACIGAGSCVVVTDQLFALDEQNLAFIVDPDSYDDETVKLSAESCPVLAIHLYDAQGKKLFPDV